MRNPPQGWPRISTALFYDDAPAAIEWLCRVFGFEKRLVVPGEKGVVIHSELVFGDGVVMVASLTKRSFGKSPRALGGANTQSLGIYVDDVESHCAQARAGGARIASELSVVDYGPEAWSDRGYEAEDLEGHHWWFMQRLTTSTKP